MFLPHQSRSQIDYYQRMLGLVGSLTRLFSESYSPFIEYRTAENLFCKAFEAANLGRADVSADASKSGVGIGIKTFLDKNGNSFEKVAEFNDASPLYRNLSDKEKVHAISRLRNERIEFTQRAYQLEKMVYHCVTRTGGRIYVYECGYHPVDLEKVRLISTSQASLTFADGKEEYKFSRSKSTLYKRFSRKETLLEIPVSILADPFKALEELLAGKSVTDSNEAQAGLNGLFSGGVAPALSIYLPLYSRKGKEVEKLVHAKSGLNQWNAAGRVRDIGEVYIPVPSWIHSAFPTFFPDRDVPFELTLPNGKMLSAKLCQQGSKALMSNPNKALGEWLLREVLNLREGELLTYEKLEEVGVDSVLIDKYADGTFRINFAKVGSFEDFEEDYRQ